jgi:Uma2 family endonuclease
MATETLLVPTVQTVADLLHDLDDIPANRVWMRPTPGTATEQDVIDAEVRYNRLCELVDGVLVEKAMGFFESRLAVVLIVLIERFLEDNKLGIVVGADGMMRISPGLVRIPDVSFVSWDRLPGRKVPRTPIPNLAPDLAVEVLSESNTRREMQRKLREYFAAGVQLVWYFDPETITADVYTSADAEPIHVDENGVLDGGDVLPGFKLSIREWFARAEGNG